jgi:hypothetical protein
MIINPDLAAEVREAWIRDQEHPFKGREKRAYPDQQRLAELLDIAFRTSLIDEEGTPVRGSLVWLAPDDLNDGELPKRRETPLMLRLVVPRNLDAEILGKLAPATVGGGASLLVSWFDGRPKVWGIIYNATSQGLLSEIAAGIPEARHSPPDAPTIEITGTGSIIVSRAGGVIGRIHKGEFTKALPTPFHSLAMGSVLDGLFGIKVSGGKFATEGDGNRASILFACLNYLLLKLARRGGGACLVFVPDSSIAMARHAAQFPWDSEGGLEMGALIRARVNYGEYERNRSSPSLFTQKANEALRQRLDRIAGLASLDGAMLLTPDFDVIGFGVKLQGETFAGDVEEGPDGLGGKGGKKVDFTRLGTRHNSALRFVASVHGTIAFVASTDGPIRGLARHNEATIRCWPDCRVSMFT